MKKHHEHDFVIDFFKDGLILEPYTDCGPEESLRFLAEIAGIEMEISKLPFSIKREFPIVSVHHPHVYMFLYPKGEIVVLHPYTRNPSRRLKMLREFLEDVSRYFV